MRRGSGRSRRRCARSASGPLEQQPGGDPGRRVVHERRVGGERARERGALVRAVAGPRDGGVQHGGRRREEDHGRHELQRAEERPLGARDARGGRGGDGQRGDGEPREAAGEAGDPPGEAGPRHVGARDEEQVHGRVRWVAWRCHLARVGVAAHVGRVVRVVRVVRAARPQRVPARRRHEHDLRGAAEREPPQRARPARDVDRDADRRERGDDEARDGRADRDEPAGRAERAAERERDNPVRPDPVRLDPRLVPAGAEVVVRGHRQPPLGVAARRAGDREPGAVGGHGGTT